MLLGGLRKWAHGQSGGPELETKCRGPEGREEVGSGKNKQMDLQGVWRCVSQGRVVEIGAQKDTAPVGRLAGQFRTPVFTRGVDMGAMDGV